MTPNREHSPYGRSDKHAIVGAAFRLPGGVDSFKKLLDLVVEGRTAFRRDSMGGVDAHWGAYLGDLDSLDTAMFDIPAKEAQRVDPQQRLLIELAWRCIEDAGYRIAQLAGTNTGVFIASSNYDGFSLLSGEEPGQDLQMTGIAPSLLANRLSFLFDLRGPSQTVDTSCSSALVAVHQAIQSLQSGECEQALVGGANLLRSPTVHKLLERTGMLSASGAARSFDAQADGYVRGEGAVVLLLKPLEQALCQRDGVRAVIAASAIGHGGKANALTSPNPRAQAEVVAQAYAKAGLPPGAISYVETHGTGSPLGDVIEFDALRAAFGDAFPAGRRCSLGCVKTNIGHLEAASGLVSIVKVIACLDGQVIPPIANLGSPNPDLQIEDSCFVLPQVAQHWEPQGVGEAPAMRRAGISAFGFGGVNAHLVLEEPVGDGAAGEPDCQEHLIVLSAPTQGQLASQAGRLKDHLVAVSGSSGERGLRDIAFTLQVGREHFTQRLALVAADRAELAAKLDGFVAGRPVERMYRGNVNEIAVGRSGLSDAVSRSISSALARRELDKIALLWIADIPFEWHALYDDQPVRRAHLPSYPFAVAHQATEAVATDGDTVETLLLKYVAGELGCGLGQVSATRTFHALGLKSAAFVRITRALQAQLALRIPPSVLFEHPDVRSLAAYLRGRLSEGLPQKFVGGMEPADPAVTAVLHKLVNDEVSMECAYRRLVEER